MAEDTSDRLVVAHVWLEKAGSRAQFSAIKAMKVNLLLESARLANSIATFDSNGRNILVKSKVACKDKRNWRSCLIIPLFLIEPYLADPSEGRVASCLVWLAIGEEQVWITNLCLESEISQYCAWTEPENG